MGKKEGRQWENDKKRKVFSMILVVCFRRQWVFSTSYVTNLRDTVALIL